MVTERLGRHLAQLPPVTSNSDPGLPRLLQDLLDANVVTGLTLEQAATELGAHPARLVPAFQRALGIPPHRYLTGRRLDLARRLLLSGRKPAEVAVEVGSCYQAHLTRHFKRLLGVPPGTFASSTAADGSRYTSP